MSFNPKPKIGDRVRIRLHDGKAIDGVYDGHNGDKEHFVFATNDIFLATKETPFRVTDSRCHRVRFIYPLECMTNE